MDENDNNNENSAPREHMTAADADEMKAEGVEIMGNNETPAEKAETFAPPMQTPIKPEPVVFKEPVFTPIPTPQVTPEPVVSRPNPEPVPQRTYASFTQPKNPVAAPTQNDVRSIRTYRSDAAQAVQQNHTSVIDIAVAENKRRQQTPVTYEKKKSRAFLWPSIILIIIALVVVAGTYYFWTVGSQTLSGTGQNSAAAFIPATNTETFPIDPKNPVTSLGAEIENNNSVPIGSIINLIPTGANGIAIATSTDFFSALGITVPTQISLSLDGTYMLGSSISVPNHPFIILGVSSFENAFAGMLSWEKDMRGTFGGFIEIEHPSEPLIALSPEIFNDTTIENQGVREIINASSTPLFLYAFVGTTKLVITTDEATMALIITDLNTTNTTR